MTGLGSFAGGLANGINMGLGLYQQARVLKQQGIEDEARQAGVKFLQGAKDKFIAGGGNEADWKPGAHDLLGAYDATAAAHAERGDFQGYGKTIAATEPIRQRARAQAWQAYQLHKDPGKLGQDFYATIPDGGQVTGYDMANGTGPDGKGVAPKVRFHLANGRSVMYTPAEVEGFVQKSLMDPTKAAEIDAKLAAELFKVRAETDGKIKVEGVKGEQERKTEVVRHGHKLEQIGLQNTGDMAVAQERSRATLGAAGISAGATRDAAHIRAEADLNKPLVYGPDQTVGLFIATPAGGRTFTPVAKGGGKPAAGLNDDALHRLVINSGIGATDPVSKATHGNEDTTRVAVRARQWLQANPGMSEVDAVNKAIGEFRQRKPSGAQAPGSGLATQPTGGNGWSITREPDAQQPAGRQAGSSGRGADYSHLWSGGASPQQPSGPASAPMPASRPGVSLATPGRPGGVVDFRDLK